MQRTSDDLCREHGLSVIDKKKGRGKSYKEWLEDIENPKGSKKTQLRRLIDEQIKLSTTSFYCNNTIKIQIILNPVSLTYSK